MDLDAVRFSFNGFPSPCSICVPIVRSKFFNLSTVVSDCRRPDQHPRRIVELRVQQFNLSVKFILRKGAFTLSNSCQYDRDKVTLSLTDRLSCELPMSLGFTKPSGSSNSESSWLLEIDTGR